MSNFKYKSYNSESSGCLLYVIAFVVILGISALCSYSNEKSQMHKVFSIDKVEKTTGDSDGFTTEVYYLVTTDKGAYHISTHGFNAAPNCAGIKKDSTYYITTRGINCPFLGIYPNIISVREL